MFYMKSICLLRKTLSSTKFLFLFPFSAYQIFETLNKVGKYHDFSAGLVIGGKDLKYETARLATCNIIICTPGRILQHMDENPNFDPSSMKLLILDEADRCLDMGFEKTMNAILENLPSAEDRQTLLFSATQTRSVKDLARYDILYLMDFLRKICGHKL